MTTATLARQMTAEEFDLMIDSIAAHSRAQMEAALSGHELLPPHKLPDDVVLSARSRPVPPEVNQVLTVDSKNPNLARATENKNTVAPAAERYAHGQMSQGDFDRMVDDQAKKNKDEFNKSQDATAAALKALGREHPDWRDVIVWAFGQASNFLMEQVWGPVQKFFLDLIAKIIEYWNKVKDFFTGVFHKVEDWWRATFG